MAEYWHSDAADRPLLVDTDEKLATATDIFTAALVCAIDCEWPPEQTASKPAASLAQLATWSPAHGLQAVILDLIALDAIIAKNFFKELFRNENVLKVGYTLKGDVAALAASLGSCGSAIFPVLDVGQLQGRLLHRRTPGVVRSLGCGLSSLVEAQLGAPLDKTMQCSAWGERPLTLEQLKYGATDAVVLLALLDTFMQLCSAELRIKKNDGVVKGERGGERGSSNGGSVMKEDEKEGNAINSSSSTGGYCFRWDAVQLEAAKRLWGEQWEIAPKGGKIKSAAGGLSAHPQSPAETPAAAPSGHFHPFPPHVPWMDAFRAVTAPPRFLADVNVHGLARQLRLWGFDAEAVPTAPKDQRHAVHRKLVEQAEAEGRVILTRDTIFMRRGLSDQAYHVRANSKREQLEEVVAEFRLPVGKEALLSRCAKCNGDFFEYPVPGHQLPEGHGVPPGLLESNRVAEFWVCSRCGIAYWQGSMYGRALERLSAAMEGMQIRSWGWEGGKKICM